jgi:hypothetical protein
MKIRRQFWVLFAALFCAARSATAAPVSVSVSFFHEQLSPHGRWVAAASYGDVWIPSGIAAGWEPYVDGEWVYTDYGWTWIADDPWGDIPYHYGTWASVDSYGWCWIPGTVWAPAWVTWAYTDDYVGWAPVPPTFALSASGYYGPAVVLPAARYVFVPAPQFVGVRVATVRVPPQQNVAIYRRSTKTTRFEVANGIVRSAGPSPKRIEKALGRPIQPVPLTRLRAQPTSLAAAGVSKARSIRVVAPTAERARRDAAAPKENKASRSAAKKPQAEGSPARAAAERRGNAEHPAAKQSTVKQNAAKQKAEPAAHGKPESRTVERGRQKAAPSKPEPRPAVHREPQPEKPKAAAPKPESRARAEAAHKPEPPARAASDTGAAARPRPPDRQRPENTAAAPNPKASRAPDGKAAERPKPSKEPAPKRPPDSQHPD